MSAEFTVLDATVEFQERWGYSPTKGEIFSAVKNLGMEKEDFDLAVNKLTESNWMASDFCIAEGEKKGRFSADPDRRRERLNFTKRDVAGVSENASCVYGVGAAYKFYFGDVIVVAKEYESLIAALESIDPDVEISFTNELAVIPTAYLDMKEEGKK